MIALHDCLILQLDIIIETLHPLRNGSIEIGTGTAYPLILLIGTLSNVMQMS